MNLTAIANPADFPAWTTLTLGFVLGLRHALDPDHLAAVSTFVSEEQSLLRSSMIGVFWGVGHTAALLVFGLTVVAFRLVLTPRFSQLLEFSVGCMLVLLGGNVLLNLLRGRTVHVHTHAHDGVAHNHVHLHLAGTEHTHQHRVLRLGGRPFIVGVVHGLAGTAALMMLVVGAIPSLFLAAGYILIFGVGSIGGMMAMSLVMALPLALAARSLRLLERVIRLAAGLFSLVFGLFLMWDVGLVQSLVG